MEGRGGHGEDSGILHRDGHNMYFSVGWLLKWGICRGCMT